MKTQSLYAASPPRSPIRPLAGLPIRRPAARAFSLMEVLLAVFILALGLIMVAAIFPVGADWTRQSTEDSIAQTIAQNAVTLIQNDYAPTSGAATAGAISSTSVTGTTLQALPNFTSIPISERCYQFGSPTPFPAPNPAGCNYYWTALIRAQRPTGETAGASARYDLYILVFRKGDAGQFFTSDGSPVVRDTTDPTNPAVNHLLEPTVSTIAASAVPVGSIGIGVTSGTVFRQATNVDTSTNPPTTTTVGRPAPMTGEDAIYANPADGTTSSPLIYVYQTTLSF